MKKLIILTSAVVFALGLGLSGAMAVDPPADDIKVSNYGKKDAVTFSHKLHMEKNEGLECVTCHHQATGDAAADAANYKCGNCHKGEDTDGGAPAIKTAMHGTTEGDHISPCYNCHFAKSPNVKKELKCADCHKG